MAAPEVASTPRLRLRRLEAGDAPFIVELLNDPSWIRYIGDRGVRSVDDARAHIDSGPVAMYARVGFGLWIVDLKQTGEPIGLCGLIKRDGLDDVDLGFALLPRFRLRGYAHEAASATMAYARDALRLQRVVAIVSHDNERSRRLLEKLGFGFERTIRLRSDDDELDLYAIALADEAR